MEPSDIGIEARRPTHSGRGCRVWCARRERESGGPHSGPYGLASCAGWATHRHRGVGPHSGPYGLAWRLHFACGSHVSRFFSIFLPRSVDKSGRRWL